MSIIKVKCIEQTLTVVSSPEISSGNVNFDSVNFDFCDTWTGYSKTAIFYRTQDEVYYQLVDSTGTCTIPKEVLTDKGIFYMGVFGSKDDTVITSQVISYRVNQGAITENLTPPDPTPDIYEQILAHFGDVEALYTEIEDSVDAISANTTKIAEVDERVIDLENAITTTTDTTLVNSKAGGAKLNHMIGKSVQDGTPTPDAPIPIKNSFDCVEMIQGAWSYSNGAYSNDSLFICCKNAIPCKSGDIIKINLDTSLLEGGGIVWFANGVRIGASYIQTTDWQATAPSSATSFKFNLVNSNGITPNTVGKIEVTVNGKYVAQFVEVGKNLFGGLAFAKAMASSGATSTLDENAKTVTLTADSSVQNFSYSDFKENTRYTFFLRGSGSKESAPTSTNLRIVYIDGTETHLHFSSDSNTTNYIVSNANKTISSLKGVWSTGTSTFKYEYFGIMEGVCTLEDFVPYEEHTATAFLNAPLCESDVTGREKITRKRASVVFDGTEGYWGKWTDTTYKNSFYYSCERLGMKGGTTALCSHYIHVPNADINSNDYCISVGGAYLTVKDIDCSTLDEFKAKLASNPITVEYELATETIETFDTTSRKALASLKSFDGATHLTVDSVVKPDIEIEYGITKAGAYALEGLLGSEYNKAENEELNSKIETLTASLLALTATTE